MRVLMIAPTPFDYDRGKSIRVRQSVNYLSELGYEVDMLTYPSGRSVDYDGVSVSRVNGLFEQRDPSVPGVSLRQIGSNLSMVWSAIRRLTAGEFDVVHAHDVDGAIIGAVARMVTRSNAALVYDMHGAFHELNEQYDVVGSDALVRWIETRLYEAADHAIANWPHVLEAVEGNVPSTLIMDEPEQTVVDELDSITGSNNVGGDTEPWERERYVLYTGNYAPYQGVQLLLTAFEELEFDKPVRLVMTGDPPAKYVVDDPDIVYTGFVDDVRLAELLAGADVLVSPRQTDGFPPMKALYYRRTSAPIVATDRTCHTSILSEVDGVSFVEESPAAFAREIETALEDGRAHDREPAPAPTADDYQKVYEEVTA